MTPLKRDALKLAGWAGLLEPRNQTTRLRANPPVQVWECQECGETHDDYEDAADCCVEETEHVRIACPVCNTEHGEFQQAVDCCFWSEFDWPQRYKIAGEMEGGATWPDAIEKVTGEKL